MSKIKCLFEYHEFVHTENGIFKCTGCSCKYRAIECEEFFSSEDYPEIDERPYFKFATDDGSDDIIVVVSNFKMNQKQVETGVENFKKIHCDACGEIDRDVIDELCPECRTTRVMN